MALESFSLVLAGFEETVRLEVEELDTLHRPFLADLGAAAESRNRLIVFLAGVPGAGKTILAALWSELARRDGTRIPVRPLPMDGFHLPGAELETRTVRREGAELPLRLFKGAPETFAAEAIGACLAELARGDRLWWPAYDRTRHEPVPEGLLLDEDRAVYLVEGNYLLLDVAPWRDLTRFAAVRIFLEASDPETESGLVRRHEQGGRTPEEARRHYRRTDAPNAALVRTRRLPADIVLGRRPVPEAIAFCVREATGPWAAAISRAPREDPR